MKNLKDILVEKLDINKVNLNDGFPIDGTERDIVDFLIEQGFKQVSSHGYVSNQVNSIKSKSFTYSLSSNDFKIWFADTSKEKISKDNPVFYIEYSSPPHFIVFYVENNKIKWLCDNNKKKFLEELNKRFGW